MDGDYVPHEGDEVAFPLAPSPWDANASCTVTTVWGSGTSATLHRCDGGDDHVYQMTTDEMRRYGARRTGTSLVTQGRQRDLTTEGVSALMHEGGRGGDTLIIHARVTDGPAGTAGRSVPARLDEASITLVLERLATWPRYRRVWAAIAAELDAGVGKYASTQVHDAILAALQQGEDDSDGRD